MPQSGLILHMPTLKSCAQSHIKVGDVRETLIIVSGYHDFYEGERGLTYA